MNIDYRLIGKRIKSYRKALNRTQEDLAEYLAVSVGYISQIERGVTRINLETLSAITEFLNCDLNLLINDASTQSATYLINDYVSQFNQLNEKHKNIILDMIEVLLKYE